MELPIHYSFDSFKEHYISDLKDYQKFYKDSNEFDFIKDLINNYKYAIENVEIIEILEYNIIDTKARFLFMNRMTEIEDKIINKENQEINYELAKNYYFSFNRILEFLKSKIGNEDIKEDNLNSGYNVPQKIKILDILNIRGLLLNKGYTNFQIEKLLSDLFERSEKTIRNSFDSKIHLKMAEDYLSDLKSLKAKR